MALYTGFDSNRPSDNTVLRKDIKTVKILFERLRIKKEMEIALARTGKRLPASMIRERRDLETNIDALMKRHTNITQLTVRCMFDAEQSRFESMMRGWKTRLSSAIMTAERRKLKKR